MGRYTVKNNRGTRCEAISTTEIRSGRSSSDKSFATPMDADATENAMMPTRSESSFKGQKVIAKFGASSAMNGKYTFNSAASKSSCLDAFRQNASSACNLFTSYNGLLFRCVLYFLSVHRADSYEDDSRLRFTRLKKPHFRKK